LGKTAYIAAALRAHSGTPGDAIARQLRTDDPIDVFLILQLLGGPEVVLLELKDERHGGTSPAES
jgi:hypothetical protein